MPATFYQTSIRKGIRRTACEHDQESVPVGFDSRNGRFPPTVFVFHLSLHQPAASLCRRPTKIYLPIVTRSPEFSLAQPEDFQYLGAFRLPGGDVRPQTFAYGGNAMTFNPNGDPAGASDGFPGSLFITGHDRLAYGELPNGSQLAEISIPQPIASGNLSSLNQGAFLQTFHDATAGYFHEMDELPRIGIEYLDKPATGPLIHIAWGQHFEADPPVGTHAWISPNLAAPNLQGTWFIGNQSFYSLRFRQRGQM